MQTKRALFKVVRAVGYIWVYTAAAIILASYAWIWYSKGFNELTEIASPFNFVNTLMVIITVAPGVLAIAWTNRKLSTRNRMTAQ